MLRKKYRMRVREIARETYVSGNRFASQKYAERRINGEFGSGIITSLLISFMMKLAMRYIEQWIEDKFSQSDIPPQFEEAR